MMSGNILEREPILLRNHELLAEAWFQQIERHLSYFPEPLLPGEFVWDLHLEVLDTREDLRNYWKKWAVAFDADLHAAFQLVERTPYIVPRVRDPEPTSRIDGSIRCKIHVLRQASGMAKIHDSCLWVAQLRMVDFVRCGVRAWQ